jgi:hypothetical protein
MAESEKVLIGGDSWGMGVWNDGADASYHTVHKGLEQLLLDEGYTVYNCSVSNSSNKDSISRLASLVNQRYETGDVVIWIQSDPTRDLRDTDMTDAVIDTGSVTGLIKRVLNENYTALSKIALEHGTIIHAVGGLCNLDVDLLRQYPLIDASVPSWVHLLVSDLYPEVNTRSVLGDVACNVKGLALSRMTDDLRRLVIDELYDLNETKHFYLNDMFAPDYRHPNLAGHEILFNELKKKILC